MNNYLAKPMGNAKPMTALDAASGTGMAFLTSELEKLDPLLREPLTSYTYPRDIFIETGGGWVDAVSTMNVDYGIAGGSGAAAFGGNAVNTIRMIQANLGKDVYKLHPYEAAMSVKFIDLQKGNITGRSLETLYNDGIRLDFDKHMDLNTYLGYEEYGTYGLLNDPRVTTASVAAGASGKTEWKGKTPDEILHDINEAIVDQWKAVQYDNASIANHILIPASQYAYLVSQKVSEAGNVSLLTYLLDNNIAKQKGVNLEIVECRYCEKAGTGGKDRMVLYRNERKYMSMDLAVPLTRIMTAPNVGNACYDSLYAANVGEVKKHYLEPIRYIDGI